MNKKLNIYHSMWFSPYINDKRSDDILYDNGRVLGGWLKKRHFYMSFALSLYRLKKHYNRITLVTDNIGKEILINKLNLPYDEIIIELENLNYDNSLWAIGKLKTYELAKNNFIHFDNDVFIWKKIVDFSYENELIVQNLEYNESFYKASL